MRQHVTAQVARDELGSLDRDEDGHEHDAQREHVGVVGHEARVPVRHRDRVGDRGQADDRKDDHRDDLGLGAAAQAEGRTQAVPVQGADDLGPA